MLNHLKRFHLLFSVAVILIVVVVLVYGAYHMRHESSGNVDRLITVGASVLPSILPDDYHDRATAPGAIPLAEELEMREKINDHARLGGFASLYTLVMGQDGRLYFTALTTPGEEAAERSSWYFYPYEAAPKEFYETMRGGESAYVDYKDQRGEFRSVALRFVSPEGRYYLACADISVAELDKAIYRNIFLAGIICVVFVGLTGVSVLAVRKSTSIYRRLHELSEVNSELYRQATYDNLTGLLTRGIFFDQANTQLQQMQQLGTPGAVVMLDIDNFKQVNDKHGHLVGDAVLAGVAGVCRLSLRSYDMVGRYGGEEIIMLLVRVNGDLAETVADRLRATISRLSFDDNGQEFSVSVTLGMVLFDRPEYDLPSYVEMADKQLLEGKRKGKDQVRSLRLSSGKPPSCPEQEGSGRE